MNVSSLPPEEQYIETATSMVQSNMDSPIGFVVCPEQFARVLRGSPHITRGPLGSIVLNGPSGPLHLYPHNFDRLVSREGIATQLRRIADALDGGAP